MATGSPPSDSDDRRESLTCSLCLDIFTQPKLLPCHHSFCLKCLQDLTARLSSPTFPCPQCRSEVTIPPGGISDFQSNFYIRSEDLDIAREGTHCLTHPKEDLDLYCVDCQLAVCLKCVLTKHKQHTTQNLSDAAREAKEQLKKDEELLQVDISDMTRTVDAEKREQKALQDKKVAVKTIISNKHATVIAMADKYRDEQMTSVDTVCSKAENKVNQTLASKTNKLQKLCQKQQRLQEALSNGTACTQLTMAKEMREGKVTHEREAKRSTVTRPVLNSTATTDSLMQKVHDFFGSVDTMEMILKPVEVQVEEKFVCRNEKDTEVYSLCPLDSGKVWISYANYGLQNNTFSDLFTESGVHQMTSNQSSGKCSWVPTSNDSSMFTDSGNNTYSKYKGQYNDHVKLINKGGGQAEIVREKVTSRYPLKTESVTGVTIKVGPHRAFDVNRSGGIFVVVEEPQEPTQRRKVKLYRRLRSDPVATYCPPSTPFNPSDVCFVTVADKEVLMIADEAGDSIHVVRIGDPAFHPVFRLLFDKMKFLHHLAPGCPLLVQPTALNTDRRGRLWVACRGGKILTISPLTS